MVIFATLYLLAGCVWATWIAYANRRECGGGLDLDRGALLIALWPLILLSGACLTAGEMLADYRRGLKW